MGQHHLYVPTISCGHCVSAITASVTQVPGVDAVEVDIPTRMVHVIGSASVDDVCTAIGTAGYEVAS